MSSVLRTILVRSQRDIKLAPLVRYISRSATICDKPIPIEKPVVVPPVKEVAGNVQPEGDEHSVLGMRLHQVNNLEKRLLVWAGKYKSFDQVPNEVRESTVERARSSARIKIANYMIVATIIGCFLAIVSGKNAKARGEGVVKSNLEWHRQIKEDWELEKAAKAAETK